MPVFPGAQPVLIREYETREWRGRTTWNYDDEGQLIIGSIRQFKPTRYREYSLPFYDEGPTTQQVFPAGAWEYAGFNNSLRSKIPPIGEHVETFVIPDATWYNDDGTPIS